MTTTISTGQFIGAPIRTLRSEGVSLAESRYAPGLRVGAHVHDAPLVSLVLSGTATEEANGRSRALTAQSLLYTPAFTTHAHQFLTAGRWLNIQFTTAWFDRLNLAPHVLGDASQLARGGAALHWAVQVKNELQRPDAVSRLAIDGALLLLVTELVRQPATSERRRPRWLASVEDAIDAAGARCPALGELAALAGVHASHLVRTFRQHHGKTIAQYARQRRIERARRDLATSTRPLSVVALDAGFADQSHFTKVFRQAYGETPGQFVRALRASR